MGMTKQDVETVMKGVDKLLENALTPLTEVLAERIATLENRLQVAENRLRTDVGNNTPPMSATAAKLAKVEAENTAAQAKLGTLGKTLDDDTSNTYEF
jgi:capsule polysaccharide export protein KpsE/RkpR